MSETDRWAEQVRRALASYDEPLLREVAGQLVRTRSQWPAPELIDRVVQALADPAVIDRRLKGLDAAGRRLLAVIGQSRQPRWPVGSLVELSTALGEADGLAPVLALLRGGLLYPDAGAGPAQCKSFESWLAQTSAPLLVVFTPPGVAARAVGTDLGLPDLSEKAEPEPGPPQEADGLEWPLRLAVLWQQLQTAPLRCTQQGGFFKRDQDRLCGDTLLGPQPADRLVELPDVGLLAVALATAEGIVREQEGDLHAGALPPAWQEGLPAALASLWAALPVLAGWDVEQGWAPGPRAGNPYPAAYLLTLLLLARLPNSAWARPESVAGWVLEHHPYWVGSRTGRVTLQPWPLTAFLLGLAHQLRLVQATRDAGNGWLVRLSPLGRWMLGLDRLPDVARFDRTLLVQPNLEILAYRQGLTPALVERLGRFAAWKGLGPACTLQLTPETVYAGLQAGETFETIVRLLQEHGTRETPGPVVQLLQTWASKRERISVYGSATLFEFASPADLDEALARGLPGVRLTDRLAAVAGEAEVDFRHYRLTATRDYSLPPEKCVTVEADGVTLTLDLGRADLLLESEVQRFAEPVERPGSNGRQQYRMTPASLAAGRAGGLTEQALDTWCRQRSGQPLSPAARLLLTGGRQAAPELRRQVVLHVADEDVADGLQQWPGTRALFEQRLGPTSLAVAEEHVALLQERLDQLGIKTQFEAGSAV